MIHTFTESSVKVMSNRIYISAKQGLESIWSKVETCREQMLRRSKRVEGNHGGQWLQGGGGGQ